MSEPQRVHRWWDVLTPWRDASGRPPEADLSVPASAQEREAEWRWREINAESRRAGCPCGGPAQVCSTDDRVVGSVPFQWWTCEDHAGASMFMGGTACFEHSVPCPLGEDYGSGGRIGEPPSHFYCTHRTH